MIGVPPNLHDDEKLNSRALFEACVGETFRIQGIETHEGLSSKLVKLDVGRVLSKRSWEHTIWIESESVRVVNKP